MLDQVHARFADVLGLDDSLWNRSHPGGRAEHLQVVRYNKAEHYEAHLDFSAGEREQRFLTLLLYIETPTGGGYTSFPEAASGRGMRVRPPRGSAVLFYSMLPDGNGEFTGAMGLTQDISAAGLATRGKRFSMLINNGVVESLDIEEGRGVTVSGAVACLAKF